jgi:2-oxoisovalerate dehydrogenase E1 component
MASAASSKTSILLDLLRYMRMARTVDRLEEDFTRRGEAFFRVGCAGHEAMVALHPHLGKQDWLHCHYRDKALLMARGVSPESLFLSFFGKDRSSSRGRRMPGFSSDPRLHVLSMSTIVGAHALQATGVAERVKEAQERPIVYCSFGDGGTQEGEVLEAIAVAATRELPVLFVIQNNSFAISTKTKGRTFFSVPGGEPESFFGIPIQRLDGRSAAEAYERFGEIVASMRESRRPALVIFDVERLESHTNADDHTIYRTAEEIEAIRESADPIPILEQALLEAGTPRENLDAQREEVEALVKEQAERARRSPDPLPTFYAKSEISADLSEPRREYRGDESEPRLVMGQAIREVLRYRMESDERVTLFGEDIADPKGDVFGVTRGLTEAFPGRVRNSPLSESTILGFSIGEALAGGRPVAFLQFADFLPLAYNQVFAELGSLHWRADGAWPVPLIVMLTCGAYKPGLGPFHANTLEAVALHTPGVDVFMPSTAADAAGLLNAAFLSGRPTLFYYPKNLLNDRENATSADVDRHFVPIGRARVEEEGEDLTFVCWGNTVPLCRKATSVLRDEGYSVELIDLRSLSPWDEDAVLDSVERTGRLLVVHEDNQTCGFGAEVLAVVTERARAPVVARRIARPDTYVPYNFANQLEVLPSFKRILESSVELLGGTVTWEAPPRREPGVFLIEAIGSSPADESVTVLDWQIKVGDTVEAGRIVGNLEADKAVQELSSPVSGDVVEILVEEGEMVKVGTPLVRLKVDEQKVPLKPVSREEPGTPIVRKGVSARRASR